MNVGIVLMFVSTPNFICRNSDVECVGIRRWGFWAGLRL